VIVSYAGDLRGIVEDLMPRSRHVRCSVSSFDSVGAVVDDSPLLATVPAIVAWNIRRTRPHLRTARLPFVLDGGPGLELLWPRTTDDDAAVAFVRTQIEEICGELPALGRRARSTSRARSKRRA
jgi:LysR family transcriptional activator of mexEF-oprN operon